MDTEHEFNFYKMLSLDLSWLYDNHIDFIGRYNDKIIF
jgi:hypothetical protein